MSNQDLNCRNGLLVRLNRSNLNFRYIRELSIEFGKPYWLRTNDTFLSTEILYQMEKKKSLI